MPTNEFYEFATSSAAYVESLPDYLADVERTAGQQSGIARADLNNRALRQGSAMAAAIGSFMSAQGYDALDDGDTATRASDFALAVAALIQPNIASAVNAASSATGMSLVPPVATTMVPSPSGSGRGPIRPILASALYSSVWNEWM